MTANRNSISHIDDATDLQIVPGFDPEPNLDVDPNGSAPTKSALVAMIRRWRALELDAMRLQSELEGPDAGFDTLEGLSQKEAEEASEALGTAIASIGSVAHHMLGRYFNGNFKPDVAAKPATGRGSNGDTLKVA